METRSEQRSVAQLHGYTLCALCLLTLSSQTAVAQGYTWQLINQPKINYLSADGVHPSDANRVLLSAEHDGNWSYSSTDNALRWTFGSPVSSYYPGEEYFHVHSTRYLVAPAVPEPRHLYMLDLHGGLYYSPDDGLTWPALTGPRVDPNNNEDGWYSLAIDPNDNASGSVQKMLAGGPGLIKYYNPSNNTWNLTYQSPLTQPPFITDIQYAPDNPINCSLLNPPTCVVWAAMSEAAGWDDNPSDLPAGAALGTCYGVLRSTNAGQTWTPYRISPGPGAPLPEDCVYAVAPLSSTQVYAVTKAGLWQGTFAAGGVSWTQIVPPQIGERQRISSIFYAYTASPSTLYVGLSTANTALNMILKRTDGGANWTTTGFPPGRVNALGGLPSMANLVYAAYGNGDVVKTTDGGNTYSTLQGQRAGYAMATVAIMPGQPNDGTFYVGTVCEGGISKTTDGGTTWTNLRRRLAQTGDFHSHFHYVMRLAQDPDPLHANNIYATEGSWLWKSTDAGASWTDVSCPSPNGPCGWHLHGLAYAPNNVLYVGTGHGNWPGGTSDSSTGRVWRSANAGGAWAEITGNFPQPPPNTCVEPGGSKAGCYSIYTIAVSPNDASRVFVGTFGHENNVGDPNQGQGIGPVRGTYNPITSSWNWALLTNGLCPNGTAASSGAPCLDISGNPYVPTPPANSLYIGTVAINSTSPTATVYIATLNGIYRMGENDTVWNDISPSFSQASFPPGTCAFDGCRRFESVAVSSSNPNLLLAGTSQALGLRDAAGQDVSPNIFKSTDGGATWTVWTMPTPPNGAPFRAWAQQYRVRDIQMRSSRAYAVIEGSGIYSLNLTTTP